MKATILADPWSGKEILLLEDRSTLMGVAYDPRSTSSPVPFTASCPHCIRGRQQGLDMHQRRMIKALLTRTKKGSLRRYRLPTQAIPLTLEHHETRGYHHVGVLGPHRASLLLLRAARDSTKIEYLAGDNDTCRHPILARFLGLLLRTRRASSTVVRAVAHPLALKQLARSRVKRGRGGRRLPCGEIDWMNVLTEMKSQP